MGRINFAMRLARKESKKSDHYRVDMGAIIIKGSTIISSGFNQNKTHPDQCKYNKLRGFVPTNGHASHAEMNAITSCKADMPGAEIFVTRVMKNGDNGPSKPCQACHQAIKDAGISKVWFFTEIGELQSYKVN